MDTKIYDKTGVALLLQVFPNELFIVLQSMADRWRIDYWDVGRITNKLKVMVINDHLPVAVMDIYDTIARFLNYEVSASTVRYYASVAEFYTKDEQDEYDPLPFSHFALAMRYGKDKWRSVLDLSFSYAHIHAGQFPSVTWIQQAFNGDFDRAIQNNFEGNLDPDEAAVQSAGDILDFDTMDDGSGNKSIGAETLMTFSNAVRKLSHMIDRIPVSKETKQRIAAALNNFQDTLEEALQEMRG